MAATDFPAYVSYNEDVGSVVEEYTPSQVSGETMVVGDLAVWDGANDWVERAGADPTAIVGICEGDSEEGRQLTTNGKIPIRTLNSKCRLSMSSATTYVEATHRGNEYGITRSAAGHWRVDTAKTGGDARVLVIDGDPDTNIWTVVFLAEFLSTEGIDS